MNRSTVPWLMAIMSVVIAIIAAIAGQRAMPPCQTEDGGPIPCVWDGPTRGTPGVPGYRTGDRVTITADP